jgi:hypothetical protein
VPHALAKGALLYLYDKTTRVNRKLLKVKVENERQSPENEICVFIDDCYRVFIQSEEAAFWIDGSDRGGSTIEGMDMPRREPSGAGVGEWECNS